MYVVICSFHDDRILGGECLLPVRAVRVSHIYLVKKFALVLCDVVYLLVVLLSARSPNTIMLISTLVRTPHQHEPMPIISAMRPWLPGFEATWWGSLPNGMARREIGEVSIGVPHTRKSLVKGVIQTLILFL